MKHLTNFHLAAFEFNFGKKTNGKEEWQEVYNYPEIGISFFHSSLSNSEILGKLNSLSTYINFPLSRNKRNLKLNFKTACGLGLLSRRFERFDDYSNNAISTRLNATIRFNLELQYIIKNFNFNFAVGLTHLSNGGFKKPNLGINILTVSAGCLFKIGNTYRNIRYFKSTQNKKFINQSSELYCGINLGSKGIFPPGSRNYIVYNLNCCYLKRISNKSSWGAGVELYYDLSEPVILKTLFDTVYAKAEVIKPAIFLAYQLHLSRLIIHFNLGAYLYTLNKTNGYIYNRLSLKYFIFKDMYINISLKSHYTTADVTEFGIGYRIK